MKAKKHSKKKIRIKRDALLGYLMISPMLAAIGLLMIYPVFTGIRMSLFDPQDQWAGLQNYRMLFSESRFVTNIILTLLYTLIAVCLTVSLGLIAAHLVTEKGRFVHVLRPLLFLPWLIPSIASSIFFRALFDANAGPVPGIVKAITGSTFIPLADEHFSMLAVVIHEVWRSLPFAMLFLAAGLTAIPGYLYEAAALDSAGKWKQFTCITLPCLKSHIFIITLMVTNGTLQDSQSIYPLTFGGPGYSTETVGVRLFKTVFLYFEVNFASALGVILLAIAAIFMLGYHKAMNMKEEVSYE